MPILRKSPIETLPNRDYFLDVNLRYYRIDTNQVLISEEGLAGGATELIVQIIKPVAYRIVQQGPSDQTIIMCLIEGADGKDNDMASVNLTAEPSPQIIQDRIRACGNSVGPNNIDLTGVQVYLKALI